MAISLSNFREWLPFAIIIAGIVLALIAMLLPHNKQRRLKTEKLLANFKASLREHDLDHWKEVYRGTRETALAPPGCFMNRQGQPERLDSMWTAGNEDHTAIQRMAECIEKISVEMLTNTMNNKMMWYEIGQLMEAMHEWLQSFPGVQQDLTFLDEQYPALKEVFEKYGHRFEKWPRRIFAKD